MRAFRAVLLLCLVAGGSTLQPARKTPPRKSPPRRPRYAELEAKSAARWQRFRAGDATHRLRFEVCDARDGAAVIAAARVGLVELHTQAARDVDEQALSSDAAACAELARTTPDSADAAFMSEVKQANKRLKKLQKSEVKENAG